MMAFASVTLMGPKVSTIPAPRNVILAGLPPIRPQERVELQKEIFCSKWLTPRFLRRLQTYFVKEVILARLAVLCLEKSYGCFKIRPG
jgi:hypothetical protein